GNRYYPERYHLAGQTGILYTSLSADVAIREIARHAAPATLQGGLAVGRIEIRLERILDLTNKANLRRLGLTEEALVSANRELSQAVGLAARTAGLQGLLVASATGQGKNLVVFENNLGEG